MKQLAWVVTAALVIAALNCAHAEHQQSKPQQDGEYHLAAGKTYNMHAHDHARMLLKYAGAGDQVPADVVQDHVASIRFNTEAARKSYIRLAKSSGASAVLVQKVEQMQKRLDKVNTELEQLEAHAAKNAVESRTVIARANAVSRHLHANHDDLRAIDDGFYDSGSDSYYETGEGHFVD